MVVCLWLRYTTSAQGLAIECGMLFVVVEMLGLVLYLRALVWAIPYYYAGAWMHKVIADGLIVYTV